MQVRAFPLKQKRNRNMMTGVVNEDIGMVNKIMKTELTEMLKVDPNVTLMKLKK